MKFKHWFYQMLALLIAWAILLAVAGLLDALFGTISQLLAIIWLCLGLAILLLMGIDFPLPQTDHVDVPGAFKMLWWAAFWPRYLIEK